MKTATYQLTKQDAEIVLQALDHYNKTAKPIEDNTVELVTGLEDFLLSFSEDYFFAQIFDFLSRNKILPFHLPTIKELGNYKGGFALVKKISAMGGLKVVRPEYSAYAAKRYFKSLEPEGD